VDARSVLLNAFVFSIFFHRKGNYDTVHSQKGDFDKQDVDRGHLVYHSLVKKFTGKRGLIRQTIIITNLFNTLDLTANKQNGKSEF